MRLGARDLVAMCCAILRSPTIGGVVGALMLAIGLSGALVTLSVIDAAVDDAYTTSLERGGNVMVVSADDVGVDRAECSRLGARDDVTAAGAVRLADVDRTSAAPGVGLQIAQVDPGALRVLDPHYTASGAGGVVVARQASAAIGARSGSLLDWERMGKTVVAGVVDVAGRAPEMDRWVYDVVAPIGVADECWVEAVPGHRTTVASGVRAGLPSSPTAVVRVLLADAPEDAVDETLLRLRAALPAAACVIAVAASALARVLDRTGLALLRLLGLARMDIVVVRWLQHAVGAALSLAVAFSVAMCVDQMMGIPVSRLAVQASCLAVAVGTLADVVLCTAQARNALVVLRDR